MCIPTGFSEISIFYSFIQALSDKTYCQKQITDNMVKIDIFKMAAMKKCQKMKSGNFRNLNINYHN